MTALARSGVERRPLSCPRLGRSGNVASGPNPTLPALSASDAGPSLRWRVVVPRNLSRVSESSRTNADDRLPLDRLGRVKGGDSIVEGRDGADVRPQSSVPHPLDDLTQLGTIGLDNEVDRQAVDGPRLGRPLGCTMAASACSLIMAANAESNSSALRTLMVWIAIPSMRPASSICST
jgi:hypothetical protein